MNFSGGFPVDLVLFGLIAAFLILRLRSILGRRTGFEGRTRPVPPAAARAPSARGNRDGQDRSAPVIEGRAEPVPPRPVRPLPDPNSPLGEQLRRLKTVESGFDPQRFLEAAENTFRTIVAAFAAGDRVTLRSLLTDDTYRAFETAIAAREAAGETQRTEIREISTAAIAVVELNGSVADITLRFVSDQVNLTLGKDGQTVSGTDGITEMVDLWTFERDLSLRDQTWRLAAARSA
ncbi:MAG TPA: Tim44/TimA family putative adaptor protein [Acidisoma sp.]|uniref:Tim44/TimA family putative adaptor protein n=1 Tax=Acidisoma sp. TaxID=1872115 RepID=UPI002BA0051B|nr:Tim44/TimA family putative adaptor protein [Acidisoma sp.]HTI03131.1 Tim44/TimA family putative adaptor protein [Acidisoma sp.]